MSSYRELAEHLLVVAKPLQDQRRQLGHHGPTFLVELRRFELAGQDARPASPVHSSHFRTTDTGISRSS